MTEDWGPDERTAAPATPADELSEAFDLLRSPRRRYALEYLVRTDADVVDLDELAARVLAAESHAEERTEDAVRTVYSDLYHAHVPRLDSAGLASFDPSEDAVRLGTVPESVERCLDVARSLGDAEFDS